MSLKRTRLQEILKRDRSKETPEERKARIRGIVESGEYVCAKCGYDRFTGGIHPYAGISGQTRAQTRWCTSQAFIEPKDVPKSYEWHCTCCHQHWMYSQTELELADSDGRCHECVEKGRK